ncbi:proline dehydrogenase family protein [Paeniglutamicibacter sp. ABSL32-1]|uniref:proline dehydrogenase family protein n=1 Tax=Paeniglutamicibacter quisquiliarum TaxID=2849498 RepID=UPI001C2CCF75|nr:proline dehydrogenase family protein [Paeniglutamicibacter quisquiliarum]
MPNRLLLKVAENKKLESIATRNPLARPLVERYVAGLSDDDAWRVTESLNASGIDVSLDLLGESVGKLEQSQAATNEYLAAIEAIPSRAPGSTVSVKLSQLGIVFDKQHCANNLKTLLEAAKLHGAQVEVDMEHSSVGRDTLGIFRSILTEYPETRVAMQANMRMTMQDLLSFAEIRPRIRLVKGAFDETVGTALRNAEEVTAQYNYLAGWALENLPDPAFGTHDDSCVDHIKKSAMDIGLDKNDFEFQMLYGVRRKLQEELVREGYRVRVYLPYGTQWYPYLMRRMAEKPGNLLLFLRSLVGG